MTLYLIALFIHVTCAAIWIGGNFFFVSLIRLLAGKKDLQPLRGQIIYAYVMTYRGATYVLLSLAFASGLYLLSARGLLRADMLTLPLGKIAAFKVLFFALLLALQFFHDFFVGPKSFAVNGETVSVNERYRRISRILGMTVFLFSFLLLVAGVLISRGVTVF